MEQVKGYIGVTDPEWYGYLSIRQQIDEVNFWQPHGERAFRALNPGELFFFKLRAPHKAIAGFGFFERFESLPAWLAWDCFGEMNGASIEGLTITGGNSGYGGAIRCIASSPIIANCSFIGNTATHGGAIYCHNSSPGVFSCICSQNTGGYGGGAIWCSSSSSPEVTGCKFAQNTATFGGAVFSHSSSPSISGSIFLANVASHSGGGIYYSSNSNPSIMQCTLTENAGFYGGGIFSGGNYVAVVENTIISFCAEGSAIYCSSVEDCPIFSCCDLYGNVGGDWIGEIAVQNGVNGNFSADPQFCGIYGAENYNLQSDSPCAPGNHPNGEDCSLIGALPIACGTVLIKEKTWGAIKALYSE